MAGGVVDAADVLGDRQPVVDDEAVERRLVVVRVDVAQEVPGRVDERVHRVGIAPRRAAALRAVDRHVLLVLSERRLALRGVVLDVGQDHRQLVLGHRHDTAPLTVDEGDRAAPVALTGHAPVAQAVVDRRLPAPFRLERLDDRARTVGRRQPVEAAGVDELPVLVDHDLRGQREGLGELAVALVVGGDGHDRSGPVIHQDVVGDPDRQALAVDRVDRVQAGEDAGLLGRRGPLLDGARAGVAGVLLRLLARVRRDERVLGREDEEGGAEERVGARGEDRDVVSGLLDAEEDLGALGAADPVALDRLRPLGPEAAFGQVVLEQLVGVGGRPHVPLRHVP